MIHNGIIMALVYLNLLSLLFWMCCIDSIISWQPYVIMVVNALFLYMVGYANGWVIDTKPYLEKMEKYDEL